MYSTTSTCKDVKSLVNSDSQLYSDLVSSDMRLIILQYAVWPVLHCTSLQRNKHTLTEDKFYSGCDENL